MEQEKSGDMQEKIRKGKIQVKEEKSGNWKGMGKQGGKRRHEKSRKTGRTCVCVCVCVYGQVGGGGKFEKHKKFMKTGKLGGNRK